MKNIFKNFLIKLKEALFSILPIFIVVLIIYLTKLVDIDKTTFIRFLISSIILVISMALFNFGSESSMIKIGETITSSLINKRLIYLLLIVGLIFGFVISIAEPDLNILATMLDGAINKSKTIIVVSIGVGIFLSFGMLRVFLKLKLKYLLLLFYCVCFIFSLMANPSLLAVCFDSGGVTTGPITSPFILALGVGLSVASLSHSKEENFGLVGLCSVGPIMAMLILSIFTKNTNISGYSVDIHSFSYLIIQNIKNVGLAIGIILFIFLILDIFVLKINKNNLVSILIGIFITYVGLVFFLTSVEFGYLGIGNQIGYSLGSNANDNKGKIILLVICFVVGLLACIAEPAVHVLNELIDKIFNGSIKKSTMLICLSIGVGSAVLISGLRMIFNIDFKIILGTGYLIALILLMIVDDIYVGIAFDSGGVASGPLASGFILPLMLGVCQGLGLDILEYGFGVVCLIALAPLIVIQLLGLVNKIRFNSYKSIVEDDFKIINL